MIERPYVSAAPFCPNTLNHVTETALTNPEQNANHVPRARVDAQQQVALLQECLPWLDADSRKHREISADIAWVRSLPGYATQPDLLEAVWAI